MEQKCTREECEVEELTFRYIWEGTNWLNLEQQLTTYSVELDVGETTTSCSATFGIFRKLQNQATLNYPTLADLTCLNNLL